MRMCKKQRQAQRLASFGRTNWTPNITMRSAAPISIDRLAGPGARHWRASKVIERGATERPSDSIAPAASRAGAILSAVVCLGDKFEFIQDEMKCQMGFCVKYCWLNLARRTLG